MSYNEVFDRYAIAVSASESPDMLVLGMTEEHLKDAMVEIARHLLALGARLVYGGDLRSNGFSELLFELVARHRRDAAADDPRTGITNYLAWPVHIQMGVADIEKAHSDLVGVAGLVCLGLDGTVQNMKTRRKAAKQQPSEAEWCTGLTVMRKAMLAETQARVLLGGQVEEYRGVMPGIAEEALLSLQEHQPLFVVGGFGGCARDIAEAMQLVEPWLATKRNWLGRDAFDVFSASDLNNGLTLAENETLARTPHVDQAIALILRGLMSIKTSAAQ